MKESQEIRIKKALLDFINQEIYPYLNPQFSARTPAELDDRKHIVVNLLFGLFQEFNKIVNPTKPPQVDSTPKV